MAETRQVSWLSLRGVEYLWPAHDPWKRTAPILFPIVGRLHDDTLFYNNRRYTMAQHGLARDKAFQIEHVSESAASFRLVSDQSTRLQYPFEFSLEAKGSGTQVVSTCDLKAHGVVPWLFMPLIARGEKQRRADIAQLRQFKPTIDGLRDAEQLIREKRLDEDGEAKEAVRS